MHSLASHRKGKAQFNAELLIKTLCSEPFKIKPPVKVCVKNQQIHQSFIQFIDYVWKLLHVSALHFHLQGAYLVPSERYSIEEQPIEYCGWACCI
jgi:hypothetical protein